jgi:hypothetical protein
MWRIKNQNDENPILETKTELMKWISNLDDLEILSELMDFKEKNRNANCVEETQVEYEVVDDFDEGFAKGMSSENARTESKKRVREWWGK